jgi:hypothetical protein
MIDTLVNLLFRCAHRQLTRPITPRPEPGVFANCEDTYVVCLECGKHFGYDRELGRVLKPKFQPASHRPQCAA